TAGGIITNSERTLVAIRGGTDAVVRHTLRSKEVAGQSRATCAKRQVVFARTAFVRVALNRYRVGRITRKPLGLADKDGLGVCPDDGRVSVEEDTVANAYGKFL